MVAGTLFVDDGNSTDEPLNSRMAVPQKHDVHTIRAKLYIQSPASIQMLVDISSVATIARVRHPVRKNNASVAK